MGYIISLLFEVTRAFSVEADGMAYDPQAFGRGGSRLLQ